MLRDFFRVFLFVTLMFGSSEGFSAKSDLDLLYKESLLPTYEKLKPLRNVAKKRKQTLIISSILAFIVLLVFIKYFKLAGLIVSLIMIGAGYYLLMKNSDPILQYKENFSKEIISKIAQNCSSFRYKGGKFQIKDIKESNIFAPEVDQFSSSSIYGDDIVSFAHIVTTFKTKESASVERLNQNKFEGFLIKIKNQNSKEGVVLSDRLKDEVANMDLVMGSFFAKPKRAGRVDGWNIFGDLDQATIDKISSLKDRVIAISFKKDDTYAALYKRGDPLSVDLASEFSISMAKRYEDSFKDISLIVNILK